MDKENQDKIILAFLERVARRVEKETGIKGWECLIDDEDSIDDEDTDVYIIGNKLFDPKSLIVEVDVKPKNISVCIYKNNEAFFDIMLESIKEELPKVAKELKIKDWEISY